VFPADRTTLHTQAGPLGRVLRAACAEAGIAPPARLVHALRRAFNDLTRAVAGGEVVRSMTGHVTPAMTEHYSTVRLEEKRAAVRGLSSVVRTEVRTKRAGPRNPDVPEDSNPRSHRERVESWASRRWGLDEAGKEGPRR
jgi:hypothetical protein